MGAKEYVLETIAHGRTNRLNFRYGSISVWPAIYHGPVYNAIRTGRIHVVTNTTCAGCAGYYEIASPPGQIANFAVPPGLGEGQDSPADRGTVMHEATHVAQDYMRLSHSNPREAEGCAYLAGWISKILWGYPRLDARPSMMQANAYARYLASRFLAGAFVYIVPDADVHYLNSLVRTASPDRYNFNGW